MKAEYRKTALVATIMTLLAIIQFAGAQSSGIQYSYGLGVASITTDAIGVRVSASSQVPHFQWWNVTNPGKDYHVLFLKIIEFQDMNEDGAFDPATDMIAGIPYILPTSDWTFSGFKTVEEGPIVTSVHFNFTTTAYFTAPIPTLPPVNTTPPIEEQIEFNTTIKIRVHVEANNPNELKFDICIDSWNWIHEDSLLALQFTVTESQHEEEQGMTEPTEFTREDNMFEFGPAYVEFAEQAHAGDSSIQVQGSYGSGTNEEVGVSFYLAFEHFGNESLVYDPIIGLSGLGGDVNDDKIDNGYGINYEQLAIVIGSVSIVALVLLVIKSRD